MMILLKPKKIYDIPMSKIRNRNYLICSIGVLSVVILFGCTNSFNDYTNSFYKASFY